MKKILCFLLALLMILAAAALAENVEEDSLETLLSGMSLQDKVSQMMITSFRIREESPSEGDVQPKEELPRVNITELNEEIREMISKKHFGGILLFGENFAGVEQTLRLISDMQMANQAGGGLPMIFFADQEGGKVNRIPYGTQGVSNMALGATGDPENARVMAAILGEESSLLGIHADFAPVVDVNNNPANPVIGIRSFSDDPQSVAAFGSAYVAGLHDTGIIATLKHFPGHGNTDTDSHTGFPLINSTYEELQSCELIPFKAAIDAGADMVMTAHIQYPQIEKETLVSVTTGEQVYLPATMSKTILTDILRGDMEFDGVIVSDDLGMSAICDNFTLEDTVKYTINAGVSLLILPAANGPSLFHLTETYVDTAVALVESGEIDEKRIDESVLRILKLKQKYGILDLTDFTVTDEKIAAAREGVGSAAHKETEWQIAENALTLYKNENDAFPLDVKAGDRTLILFADSCASCAGAGDLTRKMLEEKQALPEGSEIVVMKVTRDNEEACIQAAKDANHVILVHRVYSLACLDPATDDGFSSGTFDKIISAVHEAGKTAIVVSCQLPYDAARFPDADAILLTYWGSNMDGLPAEGAGWSSNLPAGLMACFGAAETGGSLPVNIPALDEHYLPTGETAGSADSADGNEVISGQKPKVVVLATGGTIAGVGESGKVAGYESGALTAEMLLEGIPEIGEIADIEAIQVCNVNSDDITAEIWLDLAETINRMASDPEVAGFVITHGTDTMEETAYFLNLTVNTDKPIILTGSMRPSTALSADGPLNLYDAICVAASQEAIGQGVLIVFADRIFSARTMTKTSTYSVMAISAGEAGDIGIVRDGVVYLYESSDKTHNPMSGFDVSGLKTLPKVSVLYFYVDADPELLRYAAEHSDGLVIAGAGAGEFSDEWIEIISSLSIPVVISSRIDDGLITKENLLCKNTVAANTLPPQKAAVLLRLALTGEVSQEMLEELFLKY